MIGVQQTVDSLINDSSPISLRNWNEENLIKLGANDDLVFNSSTILGTRSGRSR
jgi:hypothetical protein